MDTPPDRRDPAGTPASGRAVRRARPEELGALAAFAEPLQRRPERRIVYLDTEASVIEAEVPAEDEDWTAVSAVATADGRLVGWLVGSVDPDLGRVWWFGPFVADGDDWADVVTDLHRSASALLPPSVDQQELAIDPAFVDLEAWAVADGFTVDPGSIALVRPLDGSLEAESPSVGAATAGSRSGSPATGSRSGSPGPIRSARPDDATVLGPLHDHLFPDTHTPGDRLFARADDDHLRLVAEHDGVPVGYVAVDRAPSGEAYIDFLGVDPTHRRRGLGRDLVRAALVAGTELGSDRAALTVREANAGARALYRSIGFREEQALRPLRKGFTLP